MTDRSNEQIPPWVPALIRRLLLSIVGLVAIGMLLIRLRGLMTALILALFISFALEPAVQYLSRRGWKRGLATGFVFVLAFLAGLGFIAILIPPIVEQAGSVAERLPQTIKDASRAVERWSGLEISTEVFEEGLGDIGDLLSRYASGVASRVIGVGSALAGVIVTGLSVALFSFYLVADGPKWRRVVFSAFRPERQREMLRIWEIAVEKTGGYVYSRLLLATASAAFTWTALRIIGVDNALALGIWVGVVSQFVPAVGTYLAGILPLLSAFFDEPSKALWVLVVLIGYQQIENYLLAPRVTARTMSLHPAVAFGAAIAGISVLGGLGALIALPTAAVFQALISTYLERHPVDEPA